MCKQYTSAFFQDIEEKVYLFMEVTHFDTDHCICGLSCPSGVKEALFCVLCEGRGNVHPVSVLWGKATDHFLNGNFLFCFQEHFSSPTTVVNNKKTEIEVLKVGVVPVKYFFTRL